MSAIGSAEDLYPDAIPCLRALHEAGYRIGVVGNQPARAEAALAELGLPVELIASSATWGVEKPDVRFFQRIAAELEMPAGEIAWIQAPADDPPEAVLTVNDLAELPAALNRLA